MKELTPRQRSILKSLAHSLKPITQVGKDGVTEAVAATLEGAFNTRELLKLKVLETAPDSVREVADAIAARIADAHVVQVIGRTVVLYRRHPENPEIRLPG